MQHTSIYGNDIYLYVDATHLLGNAAYLKERAQSKKTRLHEKPQEIPTERTRYSSCYKFNASVDLLRQYQLYLQPQRSGYTIMIPLMIQTVNNVVYATMKVKKLSIIVL